MDSHPSQRIMKTIDRLSSDTSRAGLMSAGSLGCGGARAAACFSVGSISVVPGIASTSAVTAEPGSGQTDAATARSEEHTSELQSLMRHSYAAFCLQKNKTITHNSINTLTQANRDA